MWYTTCSPTCNDGNNGSSLLAEYIYGVFVQIATRCHRKMANTTTKLKERLCQVTYLFLPQQIRAKRPLPRELHSRGWLKPWHHDRNKSHTILCSFISLTALYLGQKQHAPAPPPTPYSHPMSQRFCNPQTTTHLKRLTLGYTVVTSPLPTQNIALSNSYQKLARQ